MLDFLESGAFWVETIIAALITGGVTLIIALIAIGPKLKELSKDLQKHKNSLSVEHVNIRDDLKGIKEPVTYLKDEQLKAEARRQQMSEKPIDVQKIIDQLLVQERYVGELEQKVANLTAENQQLKHSLETWHLSFSRHQDRQPGEKPEL